MIENRPEMHSPGSTVTIEHTDAGRASTCPGGRFGAAVTNQTAWHD